MVDFRTIDAEKDRETILFFFRDTQVASTGQDDAVDEEDYIQRVKKYTEEYPDGFVLAEEKGDPIGQLELRIKPYEDREVGYISLIYVAAKYRGKGRSKNLLEYAEDFFRNQGMKEYHLRVSLTNHRALQFYKNNGLIMLNEEKSSMGYSVYRMGKRLI